MSANAVRVPEINLEEFERRLRAAGAGAETVEDPLEELTRLVSSIATQRVRGAPVDARAVNNNDYAPLRPSFDETAGAEAVAEFEAPLPAREAPPPRPAPQPRGLFWYFKIGGLVAAAGVLAAGAVALKMNGAPSVSKTPPIILAAKGPDKIAPPDENAVQSPSDAGALLNKDSTTNGGVKIVDSREQPIDPNAQSKPASANPSPFASLPPLDSPVAAHVNAPIIATTAEPAPPSAPIFTKKKMVRTVSVRPDGTVISADSAPAASEPETIAPSPPAKSQTAPVVDAQPASPTLDLPAPKPGKPTGRPPVSKTDTTGPAEQVSAPMQLGSAKPQKLPTKLRPPETASADDASEPAAPAAGSGDYAVQLAAPRSESDARNAIQRLQTKYSDELGDATLGVRKGDKDGETIYRVRTSGMSRADAVALCVKLKAGGGDCFVAKN